MSRPCCLGLCGTLGVLALASGCAASLRERVTPFPASVRAEAPWELNRELLLPERRAIRFVVEVARGHEPERWALDRLAALASAYGERPASLGVAGQPGAPPLRWSSGRIIADAPLAEDESYVYIRFVGDEIQNFGLSFTQALGGHTLYLILVNQERHRRYRAFIPERHLEAQTLVHEYGHLLGLPTCDHGYFPLYPDRAGGAHCVNPDCALAKPRFRALLYGLFHVIFGHHYLEDYCADCKKAIEAAKRFWRRENPRSPSVPVAFYKKLSW